MWKKRSCYSNSIRKAYIFTSFLVKTIHWKPCLSKRLGSWCVDWFAWVVHSWLFVRKFWKGPKDEISRVVFTWLFPMLRSGLNWSVRAAREQHLCSTLKSWDTIWSMFGFMNFSRDWKLVEEIVTVWTSGICLKCVFCHLLPVSIVMPKCMDGLKSKSRQCVEPWCLAGLRRH